LASWYQRAEVFVSISAYEGFNLPILEALFFQCQVLCSDIPVHRELYQDSVYFCDIQHESSIQISLLEILNDQTITVENKITKPWMSYLQSAEVIRQEIQAHENRSHA
jgi:glycosyltransferase involved in cell wall biosynthesis